jgi:hypothetical protein
VFVPWQPLYDYVHTCVLHLSYVVPTANTATIHTNRIIARDERIEALQDEVAQHDEQTVAAVAEAVTAAAANRPNHDDRCVH